MLSIGEFSKICRVSAKTLRYYSEIGLLLPDEINPENGYRYYSINQLETMLFINRLKSYSFSLEEIKAILEAEKWKEEKLYQALNQKKGEIGKQIREFEITLDQLEKDLSNLKQGKSIMSYMESIDVELTQEPKLNLLFIRKMVHEQQLPKEYSNSFGKLFRKIADEKLTSLAPPMVLFHSEEFTPNGLDIEFAIPVREYVKGTREFTPGLCLKTVVCGPYNELSSVYTKQRKWAKKNGYQCSNALYEVYVTDPSQVLEERELITEVYYPVKKLSFSQKKENSI